MTQNSARHAAKPGGLTVRPVRPGDFDALSDLLDAGKGPSRATRPHRVPDAVRHLLEGKDKNSLRLIALIAEKMVGQACVRFSSRSGLLTISIREDHRGLGTGTILLTALLSACAETSKLDEIVVRVFSDNHAAIRLYEKCGFKIRTRTEDHNGQQVLEMVKVL